ncbi:MAG: SIS domain-containing protein [Candidatus Omnitrophica bacterium]|nr:SIS domain-containing protein [Candidatus Omnitrophota bacterium]
MEDKQFIETYFQTFQQCIQPGGIEEDMLKMRDIMLAANRARKKIIFAGNGASATIASHCALDYTKQAGIRSTCFNEAALLTAFGNDFGYEMWLQKALEFYADKEDLIVLISSSGKSPNIINAAQYAKDKKFTIVTLTGFDPNNPLKKMGDINFWVESKSYNMIECTHMFWLVLVCDLIIGKSEYKTS